MSDWIQRVPVQELHQKLGFDTPVDYPAASLAKPLCAWKMEDDDAPIFRYLYRQFRPQRHLEFGTWRGTGATYCLEECDATVWTLNLYQGEWRRDGTWAYGAAYGGSSDIPAWSNRQPGTDDHGQPVTWCQTDAQGFIGRHIRQRGLGHRVCQIYCDSREWDIRNYPRGFFDTALVDGGHTPDVVTNDTRKALELVRPGGLVLWHDFCLDNAAREQCETVRGVTTAVDENRDLLTRELKELFWIQPSWILLGVRR